MGTACGVCWAVGRMTRIGLPPASVAGSGNEPLGCLMTAPFATFWSKERFRL